MTAVPGLSAYPALGLLRWTPLGSAGGLSDASLYRGDGPAGPMVALKLWPAAWDADRLSAIHADMQAARRGGCSWVPAVVPCAVGGSVARVGSRCVDVCAWVPGAPAATPNAAQLAAGGAAVARLHGPPGARGPESVAPAVARRFAALYELPPAFGELGGEALARLAPWRTRRGPVVAAHGDLRAEHVLFTGDAVTGVIDFGAATRDHPAADLARPAADWGPGVVGPLCAAYAAAGGVEVDGEFVGALAFAGLVVAAARWSRVPGRAAAERLSDRLSKLRAWRGLASAAASGTIAHSKLVEG